MFFRLHFQKCPLSEEQLRAKIKSLLVAYKIDKLKGANRNDSPFFYKMESIFGSRHLSFSRISNCSTNFGDIPCPESINDDESNISEQLKGVPWSEPITISNTDNANAQADMSNAEIKIECPSPSPTVFVDPLMSTNEPPAATPISSNNGFQTISGNKQSAQALVSAADHSSYIKRKLIDSDAIKKGQIEIIRIMRERLKQSKQKEENKQKRFEEKVALLKEIEVNKQRRFNQWLAAQKK